MGLRRFRIGPLISKEAKKRVLQLIEKGKDEANCLLDGSNCEVEGYPDGNWIGPTSFTDVSRGEYKTEIFGPVLVCINVDTLEQAIELINNNPFGNGTSITPFPENQRENLDMKLSWSSGY